MASVRMEAERFWSKVDKSGPDGSCWTWTAGRSRGYGQFKHGKGMRGAHRVAYEMLVGPVPPGRVLDHLCKNTGCVNPAHLEAVSQRTNVLRGSTRPAANQQKSHCPAGHAYAGENLYLVPRGLGSQRLCKTCQVSNQRARRNARKVA